MQDVKHEWQRRLRMQMASAVLASVPTLLVAGSPDSTLAQEIKEVSSEALVEVQVEGILEDDALSSQADIATLLPRKIDPRRSLFVTELDALEPFSLERVMDQLASQTGEAGLTGIALFQQLWDTQNPGPGLGRGAHCDDHVNDDGQTSLNSYPYDCRPAPGEGSQAQCRSFSDASCRYQPVAVVNRFDLATADANFCGEYRIIHAKEGAGTFDRNFIIWEASMPNPFPALGAQGCRRLATYWGLLSRISNLQARKRWLERLFFEGLYGAQPVVHIDHYGHNGDGQVRTNQFIGQQNAPIWTLREFRLTDRSGSWRLDPTPDAVNPWGGLFSPTADHEALAQFIKWLPSQLGNLSADELNDIFMSVPSRFNSGQSHSSVSIDTNYLAQLGTASSPLRSAIQDALDASQSDLTVENIVARAQTQSCAGCHQLSNDADLGRGMRWPRSAQFTHVDERSTETSPEGHLRFVISPALTDVFLPARKRNLESYLFRNTRAPAVAGAVN